MNRLRAHRGVATWIAALAILMAALAPAVSHALGSRLGAGWVEICTIAGSKWLQPGPEIVPSAPEVPATTHALEHCPFCTPQTPTLGLAPPGPEVRAVEVVDVVAPASECAPRRPHVWASAPSRAPPVHC